MTPAEVAALLTAAKSLDDRVTPDKPRTAGWCATLDPDMTFDDARGFLVDHYRTETRAVMPADLNMRWRAAKRARADEAAADQLRAVPEGVPMPEHLRELVRRIGKSPAIEARQ